MSSQRPALPVSTRAGWRRPSLSSHGNTTPSEPFPRTRRPAPRSTRCSSYLRTRSPRPPMTSGRCAGGPAPAGATRSNHALAIKTVLRHIATEHPDRQALDSDATFTELGLIARRSVGRLRKTAAAPAAAK
jgi:hypothetical protein